MQRQPLAEQGGEPGARAARLQVPGRGLERGAGEAVSSDADAERASTSSGPARFTIDEARDQHALQQMARAASVSSE